MSVNGAVKPDLIDLHCHILHGLDDGPEELETSLQLVQQLEAIGFKEFYPTPHQKAGTWSPDSKQCTDAAQQLRGLLASTDSEAIIHPPAAENMWDDLLLQHHEKGDIPAYPGQKAFLLEFSTDALPPHICERLFEYRVRGQLPVVAHVERYPHLATHSDQLESIGRSAALVVNLSSLGGIAGWGNRRLARRLVRQRLIHAAASDCHHLSDIDSIRAGIQWIRAAGGEQMLQQLLIENPKRIIGGDLPEW
jgi:protein-tyrosine phosphatase